MPRCWSKAEAAEAGDFRWTVSRRLEWPLPAMPHLPATLRVLMPFSDRITAAFLDGVTTAEGWHDTPFRVEGSTLVADVEVRRPMPVIRVTTPRPISPRALKGENDDRTIGLAVLSRQ